MRSASRTAAVLALVLPATLAVAAPASAETGPPPPDFSTSQQTVQTANLNWTEVDAGPDDPVPGNWHLGFLSIFKTSSGTDVFGAIEDFQCEPGQSPGGGHGGFSVAPGEPPPGEPVPGPEPVPGCEALGTRFLSATPDTVFSLDLLRARARLTGPLQVSNGGHGEPGSVLGLAPANVSWRMTGSRYRFTRQETWEDDVRSFKSNVRGSGFRARMSGTLGPMNFTDDADDVSSGNVERFTERTETRAVFEDV